MWQNVPVLVKKETDYFEASVHLHQTKQAYIFRVTVVISPNLNMNTVMSSTLLYGHQRSSYTSFPEQIILMHLFFFMRSFLTEAKIGGG